jgi:hypothetical protein
MIHYSKWGCTEKQLTGAKIRFTKDLSDKADVLVETIRFKSLLGHNIESDAIELSYIKSVLVPFYESFFEELSRKLGSDDTTWQIALPEWSGCRKYNDLCLQLIKEVSLDYSYDCERDTMTVRPIVKKETIVNKEMNLNI